MLEDVDTVTARVIALLPPMSRRRLDDQLRTRRTWPSDVMKTYSAGPGELERVRLNIDSKRGKLVSRVWLTSKARWERHALYLTMEIPDTLIAAMRRKPLDSVVSHPLLSGLTITSARREGGEVVIETARLPLVAVGDIASIGVDRPLDLIETLRARGVTQVCKVAADLIRTVPASTRHLLAARLAETGRSTLTDIVGWRPNGATSLSTYVQDGRLQATVQFNVGSFNAGSLGLYGASRTNGRILTGPFSRFRRYPTNGYKTRLEQPYVTLDALVEILQPRELARAA